MYPSTAMFIKHRWSGLLANGQRGWYESIKYMINNKEKRSEYARNLMESIEEFSPKANREKLRKLLKIEQVLDV